MVSQYEGLESKLASYLLGRASLSTPSQFSPIQERSRYSFTGSALKQVSPTLTSRDTEKSDKVKRIEQWLIDRGSMSQDMETLLSQYAQRCLSLGLPLDRLVVFIPSIYDRIPSFWFKWEFGKEFREMEVPFGEPLLYEEPLKCLVEGTAWDYRMKSNIKPLAQGCGWFKADLFQDYYALPAYHAGKVIGAISWSTKKSGGFGDDKIEAFKGSLPTLATLIGFRSRDLAVTSLLDNFQESIMEQTTELAAANSSLAKANQRITQQAEQQLRNFAMMSHEIRTPLNCIVGMSNLLLNSPDLDDHVRESVEMITNSGDLLLAVVDDVLDYSKLATGKVETKFEIVPISSIIRSVVASVQVQAANSGINIEANLAANLPSSIETDRRRLQQILYNLLGNAIKFGREGPRVEFEVDLVRRDSLNVVQNDADDDAICFTIKDYGKGIQPTEIEKIFHPFQQATSIDPTIGGTGLGLAIISPCSWRKNYR